METVAVVGLGYVGLPLAVEFGKIMPTIGFDKSSRKIEQFKRGKVPGKEIEPERLTEAMQLELTDDPARLAQADYLIVAVPTPVDASHQPDFEPLLSASRFIGAHMKRGAVVIYESTVYPGATEEVCIPELERASGQQWRRDFHVGYSPERINPGDREHTLTTVVKVVSGDDAATLERVVALYARVVRVGVHKASSLKVAEAAKVIENTQRDLNIALMNELAVIFERIGIDTLEVLEAAGTKWNFLPFRPGLVGGHCIGVDPYCLTYKAEMLGYHPDVILAGRRINDNMGKFVADQTVKWMIRAGSHIGRAKVNVLGVTFKEDVADMRNSRVFELIRELQSFGIEVHVHDPVADPDEAQEKYGLTLESWEALPQADAIVAAVAHRIQLDRPLTDYRDKLMAGGCFIDVKSVFDRTAVEQTLNAKFWRL
ncbi:MAG: nucleotide sugar dehydrogenase [Pseudomonadota bacterium]